MELIKFKANLAVMTLDLVRDQAKQRLLADKMRQNNRCLPTYR